MGTKVSIEHGKQKRHLDIIMGFQGDYRFLSNFWPCDVTLPEEKIGDDIFPSMSFKTTENAYQAWKSSSLEQQQKIQTMTAGEAKDYSRTPEFEIRTDLTDELRIQAMGMLLKEKFSDKNSQLKEMLINTQGSLLVEGNDWGDSFFGFCLETGQGQNHLGRLIMTIRSELKF